MAPGEQRAGGRQREVGDVDGGIADTVDLDRADRRQAGIPDGEQGVDRATHRALDYPRGKVGRGNAETAEIDAVLVGGRAAGRIEAVDRVVAEVGGIVDDGVEAAADVDGVVAGAADDGVVVVATVQRIVAARRRPSDRCRRCRSAYRVPAAPKQLVGRAVADDRVGQLLPMPLIAAPVKFRFSTLAPNT